MHIPRKICIDLRPLETGNRFRGYGYYIKNLVSNIVEIDPKNRYTFIVYSKKNPLLIRLNKDNIESFVMNAPRVRSRFWWIVDQFALFSAIKKIYPDIYVSLDTNLPFLSTFNKRLKTVVTIHDIIPIVLKDEYRLPADRALESGIKFDCAKKATKIVTISQFSKKDIIKILKVDSSRISCIYESTDDSFKKPSQTKTDLLVKKIVGGKKYLITVGDYYGIDPRKNYIFLVECFAKFLLEKQNSDFILLFVGKSGGKNNEYAKILSRSRELGIEDKISFSGFVSDERLAALYADAQAFVYPTKYEGFGLPILQAMSCGCPVVAADNTSIPEVVGQAGELFKTNDEKSFLRALKNVIGDRDKYERLGYENVKRFSWRKAAREFVELIESL